MNLLVFTLLCGVGFMGGVQANLNSSEHNLTPLLQEDQTVLTAPKSSQYLRVDPIIINEASDWTDLSFVTGTGIEGDPYILEDLEIIGEDFTFEYGNLTSYGISITNSAWYRVQNCKISGFHVGIYSFVFDGFQKNITDNTVDQCGIGIYTIGVQYEIARNQISECRADPKSYVFIVQGGGEASTLQQTGGTGICVSFARGNVWVEENSISDCDVGVAVGEYAVVRHNDLEGCGFVFSQPHIILMEVEGNTVNGHPLGFFVVKDEEDDSDTLLIDGNEQQYGQLIILAYENVILQDLILRDTSVALVLHHNKNLTLSNVVVENCLLGMNLWDYGPHSSDEGAVEFINATELIFRDCYIGAQIGLIDQNYEDVDYTINLMFRVFSGNTYDLFFGSMVVHGISLTVPIGTTMFFDNHYSYPYTVIVLRNGTTYTQVNNNVTSHFLDDFNRTEVTFEDVGTYEILSFITVNEEVDYFLNFTAVVQEYPPLRNIPGYLFSIFGWGSLGALGIIAMVTLVKRKLR